MQELSTFEKLYNPQILEAVHDRRFKDALDLVNQRNSQIWQLQGQNSYLNLTNWVRIEDVFSKEFIARKEGLSEQGEGLIFIVGLPRSGKTTLETLLNDIDGVQAGGELPYLHEQFSQIQDPNGKIWQYPEYMPYLPDGILNQFGLNYAAPVKSQWSNASFIIDTMPSTFRYAGLIRLILPKAKIILTVRDPLEHCIDIYAKVFNEAFYNFTYNWDTLSTFYIAYRGLVGHWQSVLGDNLLTVNFDALVSQPKKELRRVIDFCGIELEGSPQKIVEAHKPMFNEIDYMNATLRNYRPFLKDFEKKLGIFKKA